MRNKPKILILNGSIHGAMNNCGELIKQIKKEFPEVDLLVSHLKTEKPRETKRKLAKAQAILVISGVYWESWGHPLQIFLERFTDLEATNYFVGKPLGAIVLCHSVGGKSVLSKILANFNLFGCLIPPFAGMELSLVAQMALDSKKQNQHKEDIWSFNDVSLIIENIVLSIKPNIYKKWATDNKNFRKRWIKV